jgi:hypothetical protein
MSESKKPVSQWFSKSFEWRDFLSVVLLRLDKELQLIGQELHHAN